MNLLDRKFSRGHFGASTFFASSHPSESCGTNGLPLTPNSIRIFGCAQALLQINHSNLCAYVDVQRGKHERIIVVQEYYPLNLKEACQKYEFLRCQKYIRKFAEEILQGLVYLNKFGTVSHNISSETILIDSQACIKLYGYGLFSMTEAGSTVLFPIGNPKYLPPEALLKEFIDKENLIRSQNGNPNWDIWSVGFLLLEIFLNSTFFQDESLGSTVENILNFCMSDGNFLEKILKYHKFENVFKENNVDLNDFFTQCLNTDVTKRPSPEELLNHKIFKNCQIDQNSKVSRFHFPMIDPSVYLIPISQYESKLKIKEENYTDILSDYPLSTSKQNGIWRFCDIDHLREKGIRTVYHLWLLAGGNVEHELKKQKVIRMRPSILTLPCIVIKSGESFGGGLDKEELQLSSTIILPVDSLRERIERIPLHKFYPIISKGERYHKDTEAASLPLVIREKDVEYQFHRINLFHTLLLGYPYKIDAIIKESKCDIAPFYRGLVWAALLRIDGNVAESYEKIDKETPTSTDRQIEVDIPRCHQYDDLLSSPRGHRKFFRILKAWVAFHPHLVYWQGLDSLCAPFLYLNFENEALAFACLSAFIDKYLHRFFLKDNSAVIQEYLTKFNHLIAFHDPALFGHLHEIGFMPELYAIPWFLTMFTHVFPLHKIFLLWDTLLLGDASLPLCIGIALLRQLKDRLLQFGFNECILLFSDMPDINMEQVVNDAVDVFCTTPASLTFRKNDRKINQDKTVPKNWLLDEICLTDAKNELCARLSGAELIDLIEQSHGRNRFEKLNKNAPWKEKVIILDIRTADEFSRGTLAYAISTPYEQIFSSEHGLSSQFLSEIERDCKGKIIVIAGNAEQMGNVTKVSEAMLLKGFARVCFLHNGMDIFKSTSHLIVPRIKS